MLRYPFAGLQNGPPTEVYCNLPSLSCPNAAISGPNQVNVFVFVFKLQNNFKEVFSFFFFFYESAMGLHVFPIPIPSPPDPSRSSQCKKYGTLHEFACHPCAGTMLIFSVSFQF